MSRVRVITSAEDLLRARGAWEELARCADARPFTRWSWCSAWWAHLGRGRLCVVVCEEAGSFLALAPLHERRLLGLRFARFIGHGQGTVSEVLVAPGREDAAQQLWDELLAPPNRFVQLLEYEAARPGLAVLALVRAHTHVSGRDRCPVIELGGSFEEYLRSRPKSLRRALRVAEQRLARTGEEHATEVVRTPERVEAVLPEVVAVYDEAERAAPRQHFLAGALDPFTRELLRRSAQEGALRLFVSRIGDEPVSFDIAFAAGRRLSVWVGRYHPAHAQVGPGHLSQRAIVEHAYREGFAEVDLLLGDHAYKRRWSTSQYETLEVNAARTAMGLRAGRAIAGLHERAGTAWRRPRAGRSQAGVGVA